MHGFNQGSHTVRDLVLSRQPDIFLLQEHWLTPANLDKLQELSPQYLCFCSSAMRSTVESGIMYGRPFGGVAVLVNNKLEKCTEILCSADRYIILSVGNALSTCIYRVLAQLIGWTLLRILCVMCLYGSKSIMIA